jgi:hypothetical protein
LQGYQAAKPVSYIQEYCFIKYSAGVFMIKKKIATVIFALWLTIISVLMLLVERIDLALFFVLGFIGFLVIVELMEPHYFRPGYVPRIRFLIATGIVLSGAIIIQKLLEMLGLEIVL